MTKTNIVKKEITVDEFIQYLTDTNNPLAALFREFIKGYRNVQEYFRKVEVYKKFLKDLDNFLHASPKQSWFSGMTYNLNMPENFSLNVETGEGKIHIKYQDKGSTQIVCSLPWED